MTTRELLDYKYKKTIENIYEFNEYIPNLSSDSIIFKAPKIRMSTNNPYLNSCDQINHDIWTNTNDFNDREADDDEIFIQIQISSLFEEILCIINEEVINEDELDDNFKKYLKTSSEGTQVLINNMFESKWNFNPMEKFMWLHLMLACKYEHRALKYLINSPYFINKLFIQKDKYGYSPIYHALLNEHFDMSLLNNILTSEILNEIYFNEYPLINYSVQNTKTFTYIINNINNVFNNDYSLSYHPFVIACIYNEEIATYMLEKNLITREIISTFNNNGINCLMFSLVYTPSVFKLLFESSLCDQELVNYNHSIYGNILTISLKLQQDLTNYILDSPYASAELLNGKIKYKENKETNIILESLHDINLFNKIINHPNFSNEIINNLIINIPVLQIIASKNMEAFKLLLNKNIINKDEILAIHNNMSVLYYGVFYNITVLELIYDLNKWDVDYLSCTYKNTNKNIIMLLLEKIDENKENFIAKLYESNLLTSDILKHTDNDGYNTFCYLCIYYRELAKEIIETDTNISEYITYNNFKYLCYHLSSINIEIFDMFLELNIINITHVNTIDDYNNNLLMETCVYDNRLTEKLLHYKLFDKLTISQMNINNDNCLTLILRYSYLPWNVLNKIIELIINSEYMDKEILNNKNDNGEFPFLLACQLNHGCVKLIMESQYFDVLNFTTNTFNGNNCFAYACKSNDIDLIKIICDHPLFTEEMFTSYDSYNVPYIYHSMINNNDIIKYILNHKYCNEQILKDSYKLLMNKDTNIIITLPHILESKLCSTDILKIKNTEGNNCLMIAIKKNNIILVNKIISSNHFTKDIFLDSNNDGDTCFAFILDINIVDLLLNSEYFDPNIFSIKNKRHSNILNKFILLGEYEILLKILDSKKYNINALKCNNEFEKCIISKLLSFPENIINAILSNELLTKEDICAKDSYGNTCLHTYANMLQSEFRQVDELLTPDILNIKFSDKLNRMNKYLNMNISSEKLLESVNNEGSTFLQVNPHLIGITLDSKYCTKKLLKNVNNEGNNIFIEIYSYYKAYLSMLLNHNLFDSSFYTDKIKSKQNLNMISYICINSIDNTIDQVFDSIACTNDVINYINDVNHTPIMYAILTGNIFTLEKLLNSRFNLTPSFNHKGIESRNLLMLSSLISKDVFNIILNCKYITEDMFLDCDKYKHNVVIYALNKNLDIVKSIIESNYWNESLMYYTDIDSDFVMLYPYNKPNIVRYLLTSDRCNKEMVMMKNSVGRNCSYYYAKYNAESFNELLISNLCTQEIITSQDTFGDTCFHIACQYNIDSVKKLLQSKYITDELIFIQNNNGLNGIMTSLKYNASIALKLYLKFMDNKDLLYQQDYEGNTIIFYAVRYNLKLLRCILKSSICDKVYLKIRNNQNMTCYMYAARYNGEALKFLMKHPDVSNDLLYLDHMECESCLTLAARYQASGLKYLLNWNGLSWKVIHTMDNKSNFLSIACMYNPEAVKYILESDIDLTELFSINNNDKPLLNACRYQPEGFKYILDSKYATSKMLYEKINNRTCIDEAYDLQPKSLLYIAKSKFGSNDIIHVEDERGYKLIHRIRKNHPNFESIDDLNSINLIQHTNELANEVDKKCDICYTFKQVVILLPCYHMCCIGCAFKLSKCHQCRAMIENTKVLYD